MRPPLKTIGLLLNNRDYFMPYVEWLFSQDGVLYDIVGCIDNGPMFDSVAGYADKKTASLPELASKSDLMLSLGYWKIIRKEVLEKVPLGILNVHHSFLLRYRGRHTATWAILNGETSHGSTIHYMSELLDDGPILDTVVVPVLGDDTAYSLFRRTNKAALEMVKRNLPLVVLGTCSASTCTLRPDPNYNMYRKRDIPLEIPRSTLSDPAKLFRHVRALTYPGCPKPYVVIDGVRVFVGLSSMESPDG